MGVGVAAGVGTIGWMCNATPKPFDLSPAVNMPAPVFVSNRIRESEAAWDVYRGALKVPSLPAFT